MRNTAEKEGERLETLERQIDEINLRLVESEVFIQQMHNQNWEKDRQIAALEAKVGDLNDKVDLLAGLIIESLDGGERLIDKLKFRAKNLLGKTQKLRRKPQFEEEEDQGRK